MNYTVIEFGKFGIVPSVSSSHEVTGDALQLVDGVASTLGAAFEIVLRILIAACHAAVTVVVDRAVPYVVLVHEVHDVTDGFGVVGSVAVYLHIEYVTASCQFVVGCLHLGFVAR